MPIRKTPLVTDNYYHIFNRSVAKVPIFTSKKDYLRVLDLLYYYRFKNLPFSFSKLKQLSNSDQEEIMNKLTAKNIKLTEIIGFCIMPNHFHLLLKQTDANGILTFMKKLQNSYAKYYNVKNQRVGPLFQARFKAVLIEDNQQLLHLSRYIHLNPYSSMLVRVKEDLVGYPWSSLDQYLKGESGFCEPKEVICQFKTRKEYLNFVFDQADYQKELQNIKHLISE